MNIPPLRCISLRDIKKKRGVLSLTKLDAEVNLFNKAKLIVENLFLNRVFVLFRSPDDSVVALLRHVEDSELVSDITLRDRVEKLPLVKSEVLFKKAFFAILNELAHNEGWNSKLLAQRRLGNNSFVTYYEYTTTGVTRREKRKLSVAETIDEAADESA